MTPDELTKRLYELDDAFRALREQMSRSHAESQAWARRIQELTQQLTQRIETGKP